MTMAEKAKASRKKAAPPRAEIDRAEVDRLLAGEHANPHSILGAHPVKGGVVVRAMVPDVHAIRE